MFIYSRANYKNLQALGPKRTNLSYKKDGQMMQRCSFASLRANQICNAGMISSEMMKNILKKDQEISVPHYISSRRKRLSRKVQILSTYKLSAKTGNKNRYCPPELCNTKSMMNVAVGTTKEQVDIAKQDCIKVSDMQDMC